MYYSSVRLNCRVYFTVFHKCISWQNPSFCSTNDLMRYSVICVVLVLFMKMFNENSDRYDKYYSAVQERLFNTNVLNSNILCHHCKKKIQLTFCQLRDLLNLMVDFREVKIASLHLIFNWIKQFLFFFLHDTRKCFSILQIKIR